jgi:hypothetical protein
MHYEKKSIDGIQDKDGCATLKRKLPRDEKKEGWRMRVTLRRYFASGMSAR